MSFDDKILLSVLIFLFFVFLWLVYQFIIGCKQYKQLINEEKEELRKKESSKLH